ncbi:MAG: hypothetical protein CVU78_00675 [Elusimicrobia bacterium HGW-Elusimicrobia-2]|nr:MAG: hypothetical protein CVU78_00675 [Elusimicrobia bacterium HGW-Elusimicrobia-2]
MDIQMLTRFFMWCSILNMGLLMFSFLLLVCAGDFVYKMHGKWFAMPRETFNVALYSFLGMYKILIFVFNLMPWAALAIIG